MAKPVLIRGDGVAALCSLHLLGRAGLSAVMETAANQPKVPAIMIGESAQKLLRDVFESDDIFTGLPRIAKRVVAWGPGAEPHELPHSAVVVSERELLDRLRRRVSPHEGDDTSTPSWTIVTSGSVPIPATGHHFGSRKAQASEVRLKESNAAETCWVESVEEGWLFLLPGENHCAWLLSVGAPREQLLESSRLVAKQIVELDGIRGEFSCHPRIADPLAEAGWLACGTAALRFDPLCGDGSGNAVREAILGAAVIRATIEGADVTSLVAHYRARLLAGFTRHLEVCLEFYQAGCRGPWWERELNSLRRGIEWCRNSPSSEAGLRYRLNGFALEPIPVTAAQTRPRVV